MVRLRAFKAIDDKESCLRFLKGHEKVLTSIGVEKVTSSNMEWIENPAAYVIVVEVEGEEEVLGGARVHAHGGTQELPIVEATGYLDDNINPMVEKEHDNGGTGEICGLWNSRKVAGMGFGSLFLTRAAVAISCDIGLSSLFALCAPYTVKTAEYFGYKKIDSLGNNGTFYYPKLDLVATAMLLPDTKSLECAELNEKERIFSLRNNPIQTVVEDNRKRQVEIGYDLEIFKRK